MTTPLTPLHYCYACAQERHFGHKLRYSALSVWLCNDCVWDWIDTWKSSEAIPDAHWQTSEYILEDTEAGKERM